jgi:NAD(P)-dependent dehydrogenase (short-subunit alcohol dehydrogenase family)
MKKFNGKNVIVTGAAQGVGKETSLKFLEEGANVLIADINDSRLEELKAELSNYGSQVYLMKIDISKQEDISLMINGIISKWGSIDFLVNNASVSLTKSMMEITAEDWDRVLSINVKGTFFIMLEAAKEMIKAGKGGSIINISSIAGLNGRPLFLPYAASKAAVINFTKSAALEFAKNGIRVNSIAPGTIDTAMWEKCSEDLSKINACNREELIDGWVKRIPLKRLAQPADIANSILFLCSKEGEYITGQTINVCGGLSIA